MKKGLTCSIRIVLEGLERVTSRIGEILELCITAISLLISTSHGMAELQTNIALQKCYKEISKRKII